jgi:hypothetical protein
MVLQNARENAACKLGFALGNANAFVRVSYSSVIMQTKLLDRSHKHMHWEVGTGSTLFQVAPAMRHVQMHSTYLVRQLSSLF